MFQPGETTVTSPGICNIGDLTPGAGVQLTPTDPVERA
jgi:hypothetical protein